MSLKVQRRIDEPSQVGFDPLAQGKVAKDAESADVAGPSINNALPAVMEVQFFAEAPREAGSFANVQGVPVSAQSLLAEDVDARHGDVLGADEVKLGLIRAATSSSPYH
jgi:hypothetical protein